MEQFLRIGVITSSHGVKGECKVYPTTDSPNRFNEVKDVIIKTKKGEIKTQITAARFFKNLAIVKFDCFNAPEEIAAYHNCDVMIDRKDAQPLEEGEYYIADLLGCKVYDEEGTCFGEVKDVLQTGANDVYVVSDGQREVLFPVIPQCILNVDIEKGEIKVHVMKGLI